MARDINETRTIQITSEQPFNKRSVTSIKMGSGQMSAIAKIFSDQHEEKDNVGTSIDISEKTVQSVLDDIQSFTGSAPDLNVLTVSDFVNSIVHEAIENPPSEE